MNFTAAKEGVKGSEKVIAYLSKFTGKQKEILDTMREKILSMSSDITEDISYGMPAFRYKGKNIVWIAGFKDHCSLYPVLSELKGFEEVNEKYRTGRGTYQFTPEKPLPKGFLEAFVKHQIEIVTVKGSIYKK